MSSDEESRARGVRGAQGRVLGPSVPSGAHFHPFIQLFKRHSVSEKGWRSLLTPEMVGIKNEAHVLHESGQSLQACRVRTRPCHVGCAWGSG